MFAFGPLSVTVALTLLLVAVAGSIRVEGAIGYPGERELSVSFPGTNAVSLGTWTQGDLYGVLVYFPKLRELGLQEAVTVTVVPPGREVGVSKSLHAGDADLYTIVEAPTNGVATLRVHTSAEARGKVELLRYVVSRFDQREQGNTTVGAAAGNDWQHGQPIRLGTTIYASNDERPYVPPVAGPIDALQALVTGTQWFVLDQPEPGPKLVHFVVDVLDRDVPVDVALFVPSSRAPGELEPYTRGSERYNTEQSTKSHGLQKFIARVLDPGKYYVRVMGNHPFFRLRTEVYDVPPFHDPAKALRLGLDYLLRKGDSWHANTPRRGSVILRTSNRLAETSQCVACHPTHFTTRAELVAVQNGWPIRERPALQFLTERLYNNPRPLYGAPEMVWARMISAPANVLSRIGYMMGTFESQISGESRDGFLEPIGEFLEKYWEGVGLPITESNGNSPRVSGFEVGLHSALVFKELNRRTEDPKYVRLRQQVEGVLLAGEPVDLIDLCWKIVALCELDRTKFSLVIQELVGRLFSEQKTDGTFSVVLARSKSGEPVSLKPETPRESDGSPKASEFQTFHALYALAKAGVSPEDPRIAPTIRWCLSRQWPHGGWQGNSDFKNFDTVFRDTQYAVMALSEFYRGPGGRGWDAGFSAPPAKLPEKGTSSLLETLDQQWADPNPKVVSQAKSLLRHPQPLVRCAAAAMLGRVADVTAIQFLTQSLGDGSKLVQRAAAWALRQIASRPQEGQEDILAALRSEEDRVRWGAARIFNQHFKYLTQDSELGEALLELAERDPVPIIRVQAIQSLWQWWVWETEADVQSTIEDFFIGRLAVEEHPWARRNLMEGLHNLLDDNVRYLYNDWIPALKAESERIRVKAGHRHTVRRQAEKLARALASGNAAQCDGILRSFYTFHLRESTVDWPKEVGEFRFPATFVSPTADRGENLWLDGYKFAAAYDPSYSGTGVLGRIGNDTEPPTFYEDSGAQLATALRQLLDRPGNWALPVLLTLRSSRGVPLDGAFSARLLALIREHTSELPQRIELLREVVPARFTESLESVATLTEMIRTHQGPGLALAAAIVRDAVASDLPKNPKILAAVQERFCSQDIAERDQEALLDVLLKMTELQPLSEIRDRVLALSRSGTVTIRQHALKTLLRGDRFLLSTRARKEFENDLESAGADRMRDWLAAATAVDWKNQKTERGLPLVLGVVTTGLSHSEADVRRAAIDAVRAIEPLTLNPSVLESLRLMSRDDVAAVRDSASALRTALERRSASGQTVTLDFDYFVNRVQPIFQRPALDGDSCARCHANHSILRLIPAAEDRALTHAQLRQNYLSALKVVDPVNPEESLLLIKPRSTFEGIGQPENYRRTHGGDIRWQAGKEADEYRTILRWIQGARDSIAATPP